MSNGTLDDLFGQPLYTYTDDQAVADGILVPFIADDRDTGHRMTNNAFSTLKGHYRTRGYGNYTEAEFYRFFFAELLPLVPYAIRTFEQGGILKTSYDFEVTESREAGVLWYLPNERNGVTMMLPSDY